MELRMPSKKWNDQECTDRLPYICEINGKYNILLEHIELFRERLSEKNVHTTIAKGNMGYDQYTVPDTVAVEPTFVAFL